MGADEAFAQAGQLRPVGLVDDKLPGVGAPIGADGDGLAAPDEFCAALSESLPAAGHQLSGLAVGGSVPAFHGEDTEAVREWSIASRESAGLRERRTGRGEEFGGRS